MSLKGRATRGAAWSGVQNVLTQLLSFLTFLLLARLLAEEEFGLIAAAMTVVMLLEMVANQGFSEAIVQRRELTKRFVDTAFWGALGLGCLLAAGLALGSHALAGLLIDPEVVPAERATELGWVLAALSLRLPLLPFVSTPTGLLQREMRFRPIAIRGVVSSLVGGITGVVLAASGFGVWSLVGFQLANQITAAIILWFSTDWKPAFVWAPSEFRELVRFGLPVLGSRATSFVCQRSSDLIILPVLGAAALGYFAVAQRVVITLQMVVLSSTAGALGLSVMSRMQGDNGRASNAFAVGTRLICAIAFPVFTGVAVVAEPAVVVLFGERYAPAALPMQLLAGVGCLTAVAGLTNSTLISMGKPSWNFAADAAGVPVAIGGFLLAAPHGIVAVAVVHMVRACLSILFRFYLIRRLIGLRIGRFALGIGAPAVASLAMAMGVLGWRWFADDRLPAWAVLVASVVIGAALYPLVLRLVFPDTFRQLGDTVLSAARPRPGASTPPSNTPADVLTAAATPIGNRP